MPPFSLCINLHIAPFLVCLIAGGICLVVGHVSYAARNNIFLIFFRIFSYDKRNSFERRMFTLGIIIIILGFAGYALMLDVFGYYSNNIDIKGRSRIEYIRGKWEMPKFLIPEEYIKQQEELKQRRHKW